ncbi:hypothetical protein ACVFYP_04545 [Roseomonas sp. F4]
MRRQNWFYVAGTLCLLAIVVAVVVVVRRPPEPGTAAAFRAMSAGSGTIAPYAVPMERRRAAADTCEGYNLELEEGAGIQRRINNNAEAQRLLSMRQNCASGAAPVIRSAR